MIDPTELAASVLNTCPSRPAAARQGTWPSGRLRALAGGERTPSLTRERLREILERLASGYYDEPELWAGLAERLRGVWRRPDA